MWNYAQNLLPDFAQVYSTVMWAMCVFNVSLPKKVENAYPNPIVTEVTALGMYYIAENYHQNYYRSNPNQGYCNYVIQPKMEKFRKVFKEYLK